MQELFAPGMASVTAIVFTIEMLSLLIMIVVLLAFWRVQRKKKDLFMTLHDGPHQFPHHYLLVGIYILMTIGIGIISTLLYVFKPHLL